MVSVKPFLALATMNPVLPVVRSSTVVVSPDGGSVTETLSMSPALISSVCALGMLLALSASCGLGGPAGMPPDSGPPPRQAQRSAPTSIDTRYPAIPHETASASAYLPSSKPSHIAGLPSRTPQRHWQRPSNSRTTRQVRSTSAYLPDSERLHSTRFSFDPPRPGQPGPLVLVDPSGQRLSSNRSTEPVVRRAPQLQSPPIP